MQVFDASSIIYAWDNYPPEQFPKLWEWLADRVHRLAIRIPAVAFDEVSHTAPECGKWLTTNGHSVIPISGAILRDAFRMKALLGIVDDKYCGGVGENDLIIIAAAKAERSTLVSDESVQFDLPKKMQNYKIPAVCSLSTVNVACINFLEYIKSSGSVF